jgi:riboflavin transporter FmnP
VTVDWNKIPVWLKGFLAGLAGAVGGALVDIAPTLIQGGVINWTGVKNAAIVGGFLFIIGYFKNIPSQMRASSDPTKLPGP